MTAFDPRYPPTTNSLNQLRLEATDMPAAVRGKSGYELISTFALENLIGDQVSHLAPAEQMAWFYAQVENNEHWAIEIAETIGTRLGYVLATLLRNDSLTHAANQDKDAGFWAYWSNVRTIVLGGGLVAGTMGQIVAQQAQTTLKAYTSEPAYQVHLAAYPRVLPLLGAARIVQGGTEALVLDFGNSYVKRAIAHYNAGSLSRLQIHDPLPSNFPDDNPSLVFQRMVDIIAQFYSTDHAPTIPVSVATYLDQQGQPPPTQGGLYRDLAQLTGNLPAALSQAVSDRVGKTVQVRLLHDGTAAALYYAPLEQAAVIMIGTAMGSGYPVARPDLSLRPISPSFSVA